jgi:hypothetical protein
VGGRKIFPPTPKCGVVGIGTCARVHSKMPGTPVLPSPNSASRTLYKARDSESILSIQSALRESWLPSTRTDGSKEETKPFSLMCMRMCACKHLSSSSSIYWHSNLVASADWLRVLAHVHTLTYMLRRWNSGSCTWHCFSLAGRFHMERRPNDIHRGPSVV